MLDYLFRQIESPEFDHQVSICSGRVCFRNACHKNEAYNKLCEKATWDELEERIFWLAMVPHHDEGIHPYDYAIGAYLLIYKERNFNNHSVLRDLNQWFDDSNFFWAGTFNIDRDEPAKPNKELGKGLLEACKSKKNT